MHWALSDSQRHDAGWCSSSPSAGGSGVEETALEQALRTQVSRMRWCGADFNSSSCSFDSRPQSTPGASRGRLLQVDWGLTLLSFGFICYSRIDKLYACLYMHICQSISISEWIKCLINFKHWLLWLNMGFGKYHWHQSLKKITLASICTIRLGETMGRRR